jgi:phosphoglycerate dehydrogenase-like enzyme
MIWSQWNDLKIPKGMKALPSNGINPTNEQLSEVTFFIPSYMGGLNSLTPMTKMPALKVVQLPNAGYEDALALLPAEVVMCNARGVHDASTAELAVALAISARRGFPIFMRNQVIGVWDHESEKSFADSKVAIIGYGSIGQLIAKLLQPFSVEVTAFTRSGSNGSVQISGFDRLLPDFDVLILVMPLSPDNLHFFDARRLALMKTGSVLVNVARGAIIDTDALVVELNSGRISAGLDVTDPEPLPKGHPLWNAPNCLITPHVGGDTSAFEPRFRKLVEEQLERFAAGQELINIVITPI